MPLGNRRNPPQQSRGKKVQNRGKLWENDRKTTEKQPDYTGVANVDGRDYRIGLWEGDDGTLSLSFQDKAEARRPEPKQDPQEPLDDEIPF